MDNEEENVWDEYRAAETMLNWMLTICVAFIALCIAGLILLYLGKLV